MLLVTNLQHVDSQSWGSIEDDEVPVKQKRASKIKRLITELNGCFESLVAFDRLLAARSQTRLVPSSSHPRLDILWVHPRLDIMCIQCHKTDIAELQVESTCRVVTRNKAMQEYSSAERAMLALGQKMEALHLGGLASMTEPISRRRGYVIGRKTPDGSVGYEYDYNGGIGFHIHVFGVPGLDHLVVSNGNAESRYHYWGRLTDRFRRRLGARRLNDSQYPQLPPEVSPNRLLCDPAIIAAC